MRKPIHLRFWMKAGLFVAPLMILLALDNFVLPRGFFAFRSWEALIVTKFGPQLPGMFYPNQKLHRTETGDLGHGTAFAMPKDVTWITDSQGVRSLPGREFTEDILVAGDSMMIGASLDQKLTLPAQLETATGLRTGGIPGDVQASLRRIDRRYKTRPRVLIWEVVEWQIPRVRPAPEDVLKIRKYNPPPARSAWKDDLFSRLDYFLKLTPIRVARSWVDRNLTKVVAGAIAPELCPEYSSQNVTRDGQMITMQGSVANRARTSAEIDEYARIIAGYSESLRKRGIAFIFLPVPDKENVYWDRLKDPMEPTFLPQLVKRLKELGVTTVDLQAAMARARAKDPEKLLYHRDDTHWNERGVGVAVSELKPLIEAALSAGGKKNGESAK